MSKKIKFEELPKNDQEILKQIYGQQIINSKGYNPQTIKHIE